MLSINMMTVEECAQKLNMNPRTLREAIDNKTFSFGIMVKSSRGQKIYKISRRAFEKWFNGEETNITLERRTDSGLKMGRSIE